ncbi:MAG: RNA-binding protein [Deltaproteobacteria bacterium]|nr:RNA-binding protein [Deltaproteobacteria bacterium]
MKNIFVSNLDFSITESDLRALFESYGPLERVSVITDRDTGRSRGFGFVEMSNDQEAETAISELDGREWHGRALKVNEAQPKREGGGGRGGFSKGRSGGGGGYGGKRGGGGGGGGRW